MDLVGRTGAICLAASTPIRLAASYPIRLAALGWIQYPGSRHAVGCERELFSSDALALIHEASAGRLCDIDRLASAALHLAAECGVGVVDRGVVNGVIDRHHGRP